MAWAREQGFVLARGRTLEVGRLGVWGWTAKGMGWGLRGGHTLEVGRGGKVLLRVASGS